MKTFTAKQFSRTPGVVFDAARDDGKAEITHGANNKFELNYIKSPYERMAQDILVGKELVWNGFKIKVVNTNDCYVGYNFYNPKIGEIVRLKGFDALIIGKEKGPEGPDSEQ